MDRKVHILHEESSPSDSSVFHMLCGEDCFVFNNGRDAIPDIDFVLPKDRAKATCLQCINQYVLLQKLELVKLHKLEYSKLEERNKLLTQQEQQRSAHLSDLQKQLQKQLSNKLQRPSK